MSTYATAAYATVRGSFIAKPTSFSPCRIDLLGSSIIPGWEIREPLTVILEQSADNEFIVSDDIFHMYGVANSIGEAIRDYIAVMKEYYQHLSNATDEADSALFEHLRTYLRPAPE